MNFRRRRPNGRFAAAGLVGLVLILEPAAARAELLLARRPAADGAAAHSYRGFRIARIYVLRRRIFDTSVPSENKSVYRGINTLHIDTKERAIRQQLLFREGDLYDPALARESERAIRRILRLRGVSVVPVPIGGNRVDLQIEAQDTWSTEPVASVSGAGGNLKYRFGVRERNVLGEGKDVNFIYRRDAERVSRSVGYGDPAFLGTRLRLDGNYEDTSEGSARSLIVERTFLSSVTPFALRGSGAYSRTEVALFQAGTEVSRLGREKHEFFARPAVSLWSTTRRIRRLGIEYGYRHRKLFTTQPLRTLLEDKVYHTVGPAIQWDRVDFVTFNRLRLYDRDEDINLGPTLDLNVGFARSRWFRESEDTVFVNGTATRGWLFAPRSVGLATVKSEGRRDRDLRWQSVKTRWDLEYYSHFHPRHTLAAHAAWAQILRPELDDQLLLGGDTGLRGYPVNEFSGRRLFLANVENRLFFFPDVGKIFGLGGAVFFDAGMAWSQDQSVRFRDIRSDVGVGLRFHITRSSLGHVIRLDIARPLRAIEGQRPWLVTFGTGQAF